MIDSLWSLGQRLLWEGIKNPFDCIKQANKYRNLNDAKTAIRESGEKIKNEGVPADLLPFICGFTGYGNVSKGAQEIFELLPVKKINPTELAEFVASGKFSDRTAYLVDFPNLICLNRFPLRIKHGNLNWRNLFLTRNDSEAGLKNICLVFPCL